MGGVSQAAALFSGIIRDAQLHDIRNNFLKIG